MDFSAYKAWQAEVLAEVERSGQPVERFDCLNPFLAMDFTRKWTSAPPQDAQAALNAWIKLHHAHRLPVRWTATQGVRSALGGLMAAAQDRGMELWLPSDVYPFYAEEAERRAPRAPLHRFATFPTPDFSPLRQAGPRALLVITNPLSPVGRFLSPLEMHHLAQWADEGPDRWVVLDGVYLYSNRLPRCFFPNLGSGRMLALFSLSKSWLLRGVFGTMAGPQGQGDWWHEAVAPPTQDASGNAHAALTEDPYMPLRQRQVFRAEWSRRGWKLDRYARPAPGPGRGYFQPVRINVQQAYERDRILVVPASVFGCPDPDWSVATCLYEAAAWHRSAPIPLFRSTGARHDRP